MSNPFGNKRWYGRLSTKDGTLLIYDPQIPAPSSKGVCLYNTDRGRFVEYVTAIVCANTLEISGEELKSVKLQYDKAFKKAKNAFFSRSNIKTTGAKAKPIATNNDNDNDYAIDTEDEDFDLLFDDD